jgi:ribonuclease E
MTKRMLIDATHAEETRVVVLDGTRLEDFDVETSTKRQLKGNIYLAKVVRVEPSLQAAFVEYGGNRHGFLAFSEIHPDYYQIPVADRQRLIEMQAEDARREEEEEDLELALSQATEHRDANPAAVAPRIASEPAAAEAWAFASTPHLTATQPAGDPDLAGQSTTRAPVAAEAWAKSALPPLLVAPAGEAQDLISAVGDPAPAPNGHAPAAVRAQPLVIDAGRVVQDDSDPDDAEAYDANGDQIETLPPPETVGGSDQETGEDQRERRMPPRFLRNYKIQEVIRRRQILLIQVVKEERGTKGAALTTYLSLAGRFGVLMPNSPRGGGISRKITSATDRRRLKEVMAELDIPRGMGMIVRTAGANRPKPEIKRDCEYLLRLWDDIREHTMKSVAPALIYEEASLIKRAIRDVYSRDIDEILVDGEEGWRAAHDFMRMLMPSHAKKVQLWRDGGQPLFARSQVEAQLDSMLMPTVQLRSGGYLVINQAEALVAIDVNSGRSTRERNIEETALRTNLEAADEVARQLRLRDLAGLIVIDFIDMESKRHNAMVEKRIKEALKNDRARIQIGHISHFGLLEMSRQRLRPSLAETSFIPCPHCGGTGHVRSTENAAIHVLRGIEDEGGKRRSAEIIVYVSTPVALYLLNHKRERLREIELRYAMRVVIAADDAQIAPQFRIERVRTRSPDEMPVVVTAERSMLPPPVVEPEDDEEEEAEAVGSADDDEDEGDDETPEQGAADAAGGDADEAERRRKRRRRRRRGGKREDQPAEAPEPTEQTAAPVEAAVELESPVAAETDPAETTEPVSGEAVESNETAAAGDEDPRNRRRGRRGGRRRPRRENEGELSPHAVPGADQPELQPVYAGPTPADPFGGRAFDIFDVMDQAERAAEARPAAPRAVLAEDVATAPEPEAPGDDPEPVAVIEQPAAEMSQHPGAPEVVGRETEVVSLAAPEPLGEPILAGEEAAHADVEASEPSGAEALEPSAPVAAETSEPVDGEITEPVAEEMAEQVDGGFAEPVATETTQAVAAEAVEPSAPVAAAGVLEPDAMVQERPVAEPLVKPILVGAEVAPAEKKRGWWRR